MNIKMLKAVFASLVLSVNVFANAGFITINDGSTESITILNLLGYTAGVDYFAVSSTTFATYSTATLSSYDFIYTGWNISPAVAANLAASNIDAATDGRVVITGQDPDYHGTYNSDPTKSNAQTTLANMFSWVMGSSGTGLVALSDYQNGFNWTSLVDVTSIAQHANDVAISGTPHAIYSGLDNSKLSGWGSARHSYFTGVATGFTAVATDNSGGKVITMVRSEITTIPEPSILAIFALAFIGLVLPRFKKQ